jgi:hypothetical protein
VLCLRLILLRRLCLCGWLSVSASALVACLLCLALKGFVLLVPAYVPMYVDCLGVLGDNDPFNTDRGCSRSKQAVAAAGKMLHKLPQAVPPALSCVYVQPSSPGSPSAAKVSMLPQPTRESSRGP